MTASHTTNVDSTIHRKTRRLRKLTLAGTARGRQRTVNLSRDGVEAVSRAMLGVTQRQL